MRAHDRNRLGAVLAVVLLALAALTSGLATVHRCVPTSGSWSELGVRLALVHPDSACPEGAMALGGTPDRMVSIAVGLTVPALLLHLGAVLGAAGLLRAVRALAATLARRLLPGLPAPRTALPTVPRLLPTGAPLRASGRHLHLIRDRRGPPLPA